MKKITNHTIFYQWVRRVLQVNDRKDIAEKEMLRIDVPYNVYELTEVEIRSLTKPQKIGDIL